MVRKTIKFARALQMGFGIDFFIVAQVVGLFGYAIYVSAPYFKNRIHIQSIEALGCGILCAHWYLMGFEVLMWGNIIWVYMIIASLLKDYDERALFLILLSYVLAAINSYIHWGNTVLDYSAFIAISLAITCRLYKDLFRFRSYAFAGGLFSTLNAVCTFSIPGVIFNSIFVMGHALGLFRLLQARRGLLIPPIPRIMPRRPFFKPAYIRARR